MNTIGTLAGGIAHDFNNIIGAILGNAELARQDIGAGHPAEHSVAEIEKAVLQVRPPTRDRILLGIAEGGRQREVLFERNQIACP